MSNIGKKPVQIKEGVTVAVSGSTVTVNGPKGNLSMEIPEGIEVVIENGSVVVKKKDAVDPELGKFFGLTRSLLSNMVQGVTAPFEKKLELVGVGYRARVDGADLVLNVGYTVPVKIKATPGITFSVNESIITVSGIDKQLVGTIAHNIHEVRSPDVYKGKGIRYVGEVIRKKAGKAAKAAGAK